MAENQSKKSRLVDFLLCWFIGFVGAHKFYEGKTGMGILYIFTGGLFGVGMLVDWFVILLGKAKDKEGNQISKW